MTYLPKKSYFENKAYMTSPEFDLIHPFDFKNKISKEVIEI